jgi:hypothetical protein
MNEVNLSVTRKQFGKYDAKLHVQPANAPSPKHLANPLTEGEYVIMDCANRATTAKEFVTFMAAATPMKVQHDVVLRRFKQDAMQLKARGYTTAQVRDEKAAWIMRWMDRMMKIVGLPEPYVVAWMRGMGMINKKGLLAVEFGGTP